MTSGMANSEFFGAVRGGTSKPIRIDPSVCGYGKLTLLEDETIFLAYVQRHSTPQRCMLAGFKVNKSRDGVKLLAIEN